MSVPTSNRPARVRQPRSETRHAMQADVLVEEAEAPIGYSTFPKTVSGNTHGIHVDESSNVQFRSEVIHNAEAEVHFHHVQVLPASLPHNYAHSYRSTVGDSLLFAVKARCPHVVMAVYGLSHTVNTRVGSDLIRSVSGGEHRRLSVAETTISKAPARCWDIALPASAYNLFDKDTLLYEGRQIYFGRTTGVKEFFLKTGFECAERQTTDHFLTSLTNPAERIVRPEFAKSDLYTPDEFAQRRKESRARQQLLRDIETYNAQFPVDDKQYKRFQRSCRSQQPKSLSVKSSYTLSFGRQIGLRAEPAAQERHDQLLSQYSVTSSRASSSRVCPNMQPNTDTFYRRGALLQIAGSTKAFAGMYEILTLYAQRPIVEKHSPFALYQWILEAVASIIRGLPSKINYDQPRHVHMGPGIVNLSGEDFVCATTGAVPGSTIVYGMGYVSMTYNYHRSLVWRNFGISIGFMVFFCGTNFLATEKIAAAKPEGKVLELQRSRLSKRRSQHVDDAAGGAKFTEDNSVGSDYTVAVIQPFAEIFHRHDVCSDIKNEKEDRRLVDNVCWVKPDTRPL
ncbi:uncharacterized protein SCHCODRAFT_02713141 [Schizophyllum commune H4-8]|uniref:CDR ABC transporter domain-containing protein n=1 Tax=Schizophyllum commune (strain H4-8 / FGSC 9210) TaxID=578458 RepID=D8QEX2_SCHCM|nr:uncharacterized protein SCHCODRAFT_02713141 [Schizophyllum commune H4-8]KAI5888887.1 hypothetical protein SCHCODRAFT_02713141 [Schizophyllum commune H4-8]